MLAVFVLVVVPTKLPWLGAAASGLVGIISYRISLALRPHRRCRTCEGTGRHPGAFFTYAHRQCPSCAGQTRHRRWGTQLVYGNSPSRAESRRTAALGRRARPR
jgi:hypothetical protein